MAAKITINPSIDTIDIDQLAAQLQEHLHTCNVQDHQLYVVLFHATALISCYYDEGTLLTRASVSHYIKHYSRIINRLIADILAEDLLWIEEMTSIMERVDYFCSLRDDIQNIILDLNAEGAIMYLKTAGIGRYDEIADEFGTLPVYETLLEVASKQIQAFDDWSEGLMRGWLC